MQKKKGALFILLFSMAVLTACAKGSSSKGNCTLTVTLDNLPKAYSSLNENLQEEFTIHVTLENISTEKKYKTELNQENNYSAQMEDLLPGSYKVESLSQSLSSIMSVNISAETESVTLEKGKASTLNVSIDDAAAFTKTIKNMQAKKKITNADLYSRKVQFKGEYISLKNITQYVSFDSDTQVSAYDTEELYNRDDGVRITVQNASDTAVSWKNCKLISVEFTKCNVVFPNGVEFGMSMEDVCHAETGVYQTPTALSGTALLGLGYDFTCAEYLDEDSGDKVTIQFSDDTNYIRSITYEFEKYE